MNQHWLKLSGASLYLLTGTALLVSACVGPKKDYLNEASGQGLYEEPVPDVLNPLNPVSSEAGARGVDISGLYLSDITSNHYAFFPSKSQNLLLAIRQEGSEISAFDSAFKIKIEGRIEDDEVHFYAYPSPTTQGYSVSGKWTIDAGDGGLTGAWQQVEFQGGSGTWNLRKLENNGVELYTIETGKEQPFGIDQSENLFDMIFDPEDGRNTVFYLHGRGGDFEEQFDIARIPLVEQYSNTRFVIIRWLSWADTSTRPYRHAVSSALGLSEFLYAFNEYKFRNADNVNNRNVTLLAHSMGNISFAAFLHHVYERGELQGSLFDSIVLSSADLPYENHREWMEKCDFADEIIITQHRRDIVLQVSEMFFRGEQELSGPKLGTTPDKPGDGYNEELAFNAKYLDLTNLTVASHKHFMANEAMPLFKLLLNGQELDFPDAEIGLYRRSVHNPVYYFYSTDPDLSPYSSEGK